MSSSTGAPAAPIAAPIAAPAAPAAPGAVDCTRVNTCFADDIRRSVRNISGKVDEITSAVAAAQAASLTSPCDEDLADEFPDSSTLSPTHFALLIALRAHHPDAFKVLVEQGALAMRAASLSKDGVQLMKTQVGLLRDGLNTVYDLADVVANRVMIPVADESVKSVGPPAAKWRELTAAVTSARLTL